MTWMPQCVDWTGFSFGYSLPVDDDAAAGLRRLDAGNDLDQRRLARPVFTDQAMHLAGLQRQIDIAKRVHAAEALGYAGHLQESRQGFVLQWDRSIKQSPPTWAAFPTGKAGNAAAMRRLGLV